MARLSFKYLAIYNNENLHKVGYKILQKLNKP